VKIFLVVAVLAAGVISASPIQGQEVDLEANDPRLLAPLEDAGRYRPRPISGDLKGAIIGGTVLGLVSAAAICSVDDTEPCEDGPVVFLVGFLVGAILGAGIASAD